MQLDHRFTTRLLLVILFLLVLARPSHNFFLNRIGDEIADGIDDNVLQPLGELAIGGGTKIVYDVLTFNFLGIKPVLRDIARTVVIEGGGFVLSNLISSLWSLIGIIAQFIYWFIEFNVMLTWRIKWDIKSFILDQIIQGLFGRSLNTFVGRSLVEEILHYADDKP